MNFSKIYQSQQKYKCGLSTGKINIYNGSFIYNLPLLSLGSGNYKISTSLVYNSHYNETDFLSKILGLGNGWKYNFEQFLFPYTESYNIDGFNYSDYVYIDSNWCMHRFVRYKRSASYGENEAAYYDQSGTGLKLVIKNNDNPKIYDDLGNVYIFDNERLVRYVSGINAEIQKEIEYDDIAINRVKSIYDVRKKNSKIEFKYNNLGLPYEIKTNVKTLYYELLYDEKKLIKILKKNNNLINELQEFTYNSSGLIENIINCENLETLRFSYVFEEGLYKVSKTIVCTAFKEMQTTFSDAEIYLGEKNYIGENNYITNKSINRNNYVLKFPEKYIKEVLNYSYKSIYTDIVNRKNIIMRYYFDTDGRTICNLEHKKNEEKYFTTNRSTGWEIPINGDSKIFINNIQAKEVFKQDNKYTMNIANELLNSFKNNIKEESDECLENFVLSFWVKFNNNNDSTLIASLKYKLDGYTKESKVIINKTLGNVWQFVSLNLNLEEPQKILSDLSIEFNVDNDLQLINDKIYITDVRIDKGNNQTICIDNAKITDLNYKELKLGSKLYYLDNSEEKEVELNSQFYLTEEDIIATYRSIFYSKKNYSNTFDLFYCNKTKVKSVYYVSPISSKLYDGSSNNEFKYYKFGFDEFNDNDSVENNGIPNYHFRRLDLVSIEDDNRTYIITEIQRRIHSRGNNRYYFETKTAFAPAIKADSNKRISDEISTINYVWTNDDGTERAKKYYKKIFENSETGEKIYRRIITENSYDNYGNIILSQTYEEGNSSSEILEKKYKYDSNHENLVEVQEGNDIIVYTYNNDGKVESINDSNNYIFYEYDDFDELKLIKFFDKNKNLLHQNNISYDRKGNVTGLFDSSGIKHGFIYNANSDICEVFRQGSLLEKYNNIVTDNEDYSNEKIYQDVNTTYIKIEKYDKYGRIVSSKTAKESKDGVIDEKETVYEYEQNNNYSQLIGRVKQIFDPFTGGKYTYVYDDNDGTTTDIYDSSNNFNIKSKPNGSKEYNITNDNKKIVLSIQKEDQLNDNPKYTYYYTNDRLVEENDPLKYYSYDYEYDNIGRLKSRKGLKDEYANAIIDINKNYQYERNTVIPNSISYTVNSQIKEDGNITSATLNFNNVIRNGNITNVIEEGERFVKNPKNKDSLTKVSFTPKNTEYYYDEYNRLIKEITEDGNTFEYVYDNVSNMIKYIKKNDVIIKSFTYDTNRLTKIINNDIITNVKYDNYGNILKTDEGTITYNSRNLMNSYLKNDEIFTYLYNYQGIRYQKSKDNEYKVNYYLEGTKIVGEDLVDKDGNIIRKFRYFYDASGICGINYITSDNTDHYYNFVKDSLGNVAKIMYRGKYIGEYIYDAWGNCKIKSLSASNDLDIYVLENNPFRYKGYYLDVETNLYYCNTRYYSPALCSWLSPDEIVYLDYESMNGLNLYCYCYNNPIMYVDPNGNRATAWWEWVLAGVIVAGLIVGSVFTGGLVAAAFAGAAIGAGLSLGTQAFSGQLNWGQFALDTGVGALTGLIGGSGITRGLATLLGGVIGAGSNFVSQLIGGTEIEDISIMQIIVAGTIGAVASFVGGAGARNKAAINKGKGVQEATKKLNRVVQRIANGTRFKSLTTAQTAFTNAMNGLTSAIQSEMSKMFATAMTAYAVSTIGFNIADAIFEEEELWVF